MNDHDELLRWELSEWDPWNFELSNLETAKVFNGVVIFESVLVFALNTLVVALAARNPHLLDTAANILFAGLCLSNALYGLTIAAERVKLVHEYHWSKEMCTLFSSTNVVFVTMSVLVMVCISGERYLSVVRSYHVSRRKAYTVVCACALVAVGHSLLHLINGGIGVITKSGIFCYPTAFHSWLGLLDFLLLAGNMVAIVFGYLSVLYKIRDSYRSVKKVSNAPEFGAATIQSLETAVNESIEKRNNLSVQSLGPGAASNPFLSATSSNPGTGNTYVTLSITSPMQRAFSAGALPLPGNVAPTPTPTPVGETQQPESQTQLVRPVKLPTQRRKKRSTQEEQKRQSELRVLRRGILSFLGFLITLIPFTIVIFEGFLNGRRASLAVDTFFVVSKFASEMCDPLILLTLDRHFNQALRTTFGMRPRRG
ncbi:hypothetical protein H9P43_005604 [Blastocladiella emersonii ATCC 22665]|nr:hypothetical protein H9P43_005604 [Blastocladiella emersonii ATCC 22665]